MSGRKAQLGVKVLIMCTFKRDTKRMLSYLGWCTFGWGLLWVKGLMDGSAESMERLDAICTFVVELSERKQLFLTSLGVHAVKNPIQKAPHHLSRDIKVEGNCF